jgi:flagellar hook assembly protein FlgD
VASRASPPRPTPLLAAALALAGALLAGAPARAAAPTLSGVGVDVSVFSPDGDVVQDSVRYSYTLGGDTATVLIQVQPGSETSPGGSGILTLRNQSRPPGSDRVVWDGRDSTGAPQPDGYYWFVASASNSDGSVAAVPVRVRLDTVAPQVSVISVANPYAPLAPGADSLARVTVNLADVEPGDGLTLTFTGPQPQTQAYTADYDLSGGGLFVAGWNGSDRMDGIYGVTARVHDDAGHSQQATGPSLNLDVEPPESRILSPARSDTNGIIRRVEAAASDRSGLGLVRMTVSSAGGSVADSLCPCAVDSVGFGIDLPDSVAAADSLSVTLFLTDMPGQEATATYTLRTDTLPPAPPVLDRMPTTTVTSTLSLSGTAAGAESVFVRRDGVVSARARVSGNTRFSVSVALPLGVSTLDALARDAATNVSAPTASWQVLFEQPLGVHVPERFLAGDAVQVILVAPGKGVSVYIYSLTGRLVRTLESTSQTTVYQLVWDLKDASGGPVGSGPYVFRVVATQQDGSALEARVAAVATP